MIKSVKSGDGKKAKYLKITLILEQKQTKINYQNYQKNSKRLEIRNKNKKKNNA